MQHTQACDTKYVYVEVIIGKDIKTYDVAAGLFKGIAKIDGSYYVLLAGLNKATDCYNLDHYGIMTIEELERDYRNLIFFTAGETDQSAAVAELERLQSKLERADMVLSNDRRVIDVEKYTNVPAGYWRGEAIGKEDISAGVTGVGSFASSNTRIQKNKTTYQQTQVKKDPEPAIFGRKKGKKPGKAALELMLTKIEQIKSGEVTPVLPEILGEDEDGVTKAGYKDIYNNYGCSY
jgi:hypothetical protein